MATKKNKSTKKPWVASHAKKTGKGKVPLKILETRLVRLNNIVAARGGKSLVKKGK